MDFAQYQSGKWNATPHTCCKACHLRNKPPRKRFLEHNSNEEDPDPPPFVAPVVASAKASFSGHPRLDIRISMPSASGTFDIDIPGAVVDSGAQVCLLPEQALRGFPTPTNCCDPLKTPVRMANADAITVKRVVDGTISAVSNTGERLFHSGRIYIASGIRDCYISCDAMRDLKIINERFPLPGSGDSPSCGLCVAAAKTDETPCDCPRRTAPPTPPPFLPFSATVENIPKMKAWLLRHFASSTFNQCPHQLLPVMTGPPLEIHLDPDATPRYVSTPSTVPLHWQEKVKADIDRDVRMGVIEPVTQPSQWCHRMVVVRKHDGTPCRCVDLQPLNKHCRTVA